MEYEEERFSHAVRGLTGRETAEPSRFNTFCNLCQKRVPKGSECLVISSEDGDVQFYVHVDCAVARFRVHRSEFLQDIKQRPGTRRTGQPVKKVHVAEVAAYCHFCRLVIQVGDPYVRDKKRRFHRSGVGDCYERHRSALARVKESLSPRSTRTPRRRAAKSQPVASAPGSDQKNC